MMVCIGFSKLNYMTQMNRRQWMYGDRRTSEFIEGLHNFGDVARANILSWEFRDSSHGDGLSEGLDSVRRWIQLGIVPTEIPRFTQVQGPPRRR
jgi:hypothetical protein